MLGNAAFEFDWALVADRGVQPDWIVKVLDEFRSTACGVLVRFVLFVSNFLGLVAFEKRFHRGVVVAVPSTAHALNQLMLTQLLAECTAGVLRSAIAVDNDTWAGDAKRDGISQRSNNELRVNRSAGFPADDLASMQVNEGCQVRESFFGRNVSDVGQPDFVKRFGGEVLVQAVWCDWVIVVGVCCGNAEFGAAICSNPCHTHVFGNGIEATGNTTSKELLVNAWAAIGIMMFLRMNLDDRVGDIRLPDLDR